MHNRAWRLGHWLMESVGFDSFDGFFLETCAKAVVTKTLSAASQDLLHFSIVLVSVYVCLAVAAVVLFGEDVEEFSTLDRPLAADLVKSGELDPAVPQQRCSHDLLSSLVGRVRLGCLTGMQFGNLFYFCVVLCGAPNGEISKDQMASVGRVLAGTWLWFFAAWMKLKDQQRSG